MNSNLQLEKTIPKEIEEFSEDSNKKEAHFNHFQNPKIGLKSTKRDKEEEEKGNHQSQPFDIQGSNAHHWKNPRSEYQPECCLLGFYHNISAWFQRRCPICFDLMLWRPKTTLENCQHSFHSECLKRYSETMIDEKNFPIRCAMDGCHHLILECEIVKNLDKNYKEKFYSFTLKHFVETHNNQIFCCPSPDCEYFAFLDELPGRHFQCGKCEKRHCMKCGSSWHDNMTCEEAKEQTEFAEVASKNGYRRCDSCKMYIEKNGGCNSMACRCRNHFIWK